jgi:hypothetical protein
VTVPPAVVITTSFAPAVPNGAVTTICVDVLLVTVAVVPPIVTDVAFERLVPVIVTEVPPAVEPDVGVKEVKVGGDRV